MPGDIGYLKVVGVGPNLDGQKESTRIRNAIRTLDQKKIVNWIVDLRYNSGGNVNVMLSGLAPLFDAEQVASVRGDEDQTIGVAEIKQGDFWYFGIRPFEITDTTRISDPKIAVLTSRWTVSSGELVAVAFKGQKNTRFFGEATGGYTTYTGWEMIDDQVVLVIATGVFTDRNGISYEENVKPDTEVAFEISKDRKSDKAISAASRWLQGK